MCRLYLTHLVLSLMLVFNSARESSYQGVQVMGEYVVSSSGTGQQVHCSRFSLSTPEMPHVTRAASFTRPRDQPTISSCDLRSSLPSSTIPNYDVLSQILSSIEPLYSKSSLPFLTKPDLPTCLSPARQLSSSLAVSNFLALRGPSSLRTHTST